MCVCERERDRQTDRERERQSLGIRGAWINGVFFEEVFIEAWE